ncbi:MAG: hypothetical protein IPM57_01025 [Oligoflexia bacterium]|nr:hypothetical protein [Oligoflexia bacterium]
MIKIFLLFNLLFFTSEALAKEKIVTNRKTQRVDFDSETIDGQARNPDGSYVVQKRSIDFVPLYKVREQFDENIKNSTEYLK